MTDGGEGLKPISSIETAAGIWTLAGAGFDTMVAAAATVKPPRAAAGAGLPYIFGGGAIVSPGWAGIDRDCRP